MKIQINVLFSQKNKFSFLKNKYIILLFALFFGLVSPLLLTESMISNFNEVRRNYILLEKKTTETIQIETSKWNKLTDKKEIFYKNDFYDIKKVVQNNNKTTLILVKDSFENVVKLSLNKKSSKKEKNSKQYSQYADFKVLINKKHAFLKNKIVFISSKISLILFKSPLSKLNKPPIS